MVAPSVTQSRVELPSEVVFSGWLELHLPKEKETGPHASCATIPVFWMLRSTYPCCGGHRKAHPPPGENEGCMSMTGVVGVCWHPFTGSQLSVVQQLPSSQFVGGPPWHDPPLQRSPVVQALLSLHGFVFGACVHPLVGLHPSVVHTLPSSQFGAGPPWQLPPPHVSFVVQALLSLHGLVLFVCVHPPGTEESHPSVVHGLPSSQFVPPVPWHEPPEHTSPLVQELPSSHGFVLFVWTHPPGAVGLHVSVVQTLTSSQFSGGPPTHDPPAHVSFVVQMLPSSHGFVLFVCVHPLVGLHPSVVQTLLSLQLSPGPP